MGNKKLLIFIFMLFCINSHAQEEVIRLYNPSFEGFAKRGGDPFAPRTIGWTDCGSGVYFQSTTPHDIHYGRPRNSKDTTAFFRVIQPASEGNTFLGMVARENDTYEAVTQKLSSPLRGGKCYAFSVDLSKSETYTSPMPVNASSKIYKRPIVLRIWGGNTPCSRRQLLAESEAVTNNEWKQFDFEFRPKQDFKYIIISAYYKTPVLLPYNGNVLVDNASDIVRIPCPVEELAANEEEDDDESINGNALAEAKREKEKKEEIEQRQEVNLPAPPPLQNTADNNSQESEELDKKPVITINEELDRSSLKKGKTVKIKNIFFAADSSKIDPRSTPALKELAEFLKYNKDIKIEIGGHTNIRPPHEYCDSLSTARAESVSLFLRLEGVDESQLEFKGYGKRKPIKNADTKEARARNQRVEIKVLEIGN